VGSVQPAEATTGNPFERFGKVSEHMAKVAFAWGLSQTAWGWYKKAKTRAEERTRYTVKVPGTDEVFTDLHEWLLAQMPVEDQRALVASSGNFGNGVMARLLTVDDCESPEPGVPSQPKAPSAPPIRLRYDGTRQQALVLEGHPVTVEVERDETKHWDKIPDNYQAMSQRLVFTARSPEGRDAVLRQIQAMVDARQEKPGPPAMRMADRWGDGWSRRADLPSRALDSVVLKAGQMERLVDDLGQFLSEEEEYNRRSLSWHRGYLFSGPPGTGKTSVAKAIANHFKLPVYYLPMGQMKEDAEFLRLVTNVNARSMLVLEDVDVFHAMTTRDDSDGRVTLSAVLNALDGIWTPHGLITVMTTNDRGALDEALLRPGRVDCEEEFTGLDAEQAVRLFEWFYDRPFRVDTADGHRGRLQWQALGDGDEYTWWEADCDGHVFEHYSPAELIGAMSRAKDDPGMALKVLADG
jgi:hypothetical protein